MEWNQLVPELTVSRFPESLRFYVDVVGFRVRYRRVNPNFAYLDMEDAQLMIEEFHGDGWNVDELARPFGRGVNFQIEISHVAVLRDQLVTNGYSLSRDLEDSWYDTGQILCGQREFLVQDPDGYLLRFSEFLRNKERNV